MTGDWHYRILGEEFGPVSFEMIGELAAGGTLAPEHELRCGEGPWLEAGSIVGLFPEPEEMHDLSDLKFEFGDSGELHIPVVPASAAGLSAGIAAPAEPDTDFAVADSVVVRPRGLDTAARDPSRAGTSGADIGDPQRETAELAALDTREMVVPKTGPLPPRPPAPPGEPQVRTARSGKRPKKAQRKPPPEDTIAGWLSAEVPEESADAPPPGPSAPGRFSAPAREAPAPPSVSHAAAATAPRPTPAPSSRYTSSAVSASMASLASQASVERDVARDRRTRSGPSFAWIGSAGGWLAGNIKYVAIAAIVLAGAAWVLSPRSDPHKAYHETYTGLYNEFKSLRSRKAGADEWDKFEGDVKMGVAPIVAKLEQEVERSSGKVKEGQTRLLEIGRDHLPDMLETARQKPSQAEKEFQEAMKEAVAAFNYFK